jgi:hypothetical protein
MIKEKKISSRRASESAKEVKEERDCERERKKEGRGTCRQNGP